MSITKERIEHLKSIKRYENSEETYDELQDLCALALKGLAAEKLEKNLIETTCNDGCGDCWLNKQSALFAVAEFKKECGV